jgi:hypothetical protein
VNRIREVNGQRHSWFRLESRPTLPINHDCRESVKYASAGSFPEFGVLGKEAGYPD